MKVTVIGLGLIGGSIALDLKKTGFADTITGIETNAAHSNSAVELGLADEITDFEPAIDNADLIIVATPVDQAKKILPEILDRIKNQIVTDVCSTKNEICDLIKNHPKRKQFVASHPMAGTEFSGPNAAELHLFDSKTSIICNREESSSNALHLVRKMYQHLNMNIVYMNAEQHDIHAAYVSHISHVSSFALALTVLEKEKDERQIFNMAGGGFKSTVRLAKSSKEMWTPIFKQNSKNIVEVLDTYIKILKNFRNHINNHNENEMNHLIEEANKINRII